MPGFGHIGDFWKRYDELADRSDREMLTNLNGNLDVLLIFAGLFSAVNTAFIAAAMPGLSPSPSDRTNALLELLVLHQNNTSTAPTLPDSNFSPTQNTIVANCFLYASLCCSLMAAMGAMLTKEWLQSYSRSGQAGPLEEQSRFRQAKYTAAKEWHLESIILFLPNLLLLSVLLFFVGLAVFLLAVNPSVAAIVIVFLGVGMTLSAVTFVAGTMSPLCPYQSAISWALRRSMAFPAWCGRVLTCIGNNLRTSIGSIARSRRSTDWILTKFWECIHGLREFLGMRNSLDLDDDGSQSRSSSLDVALSEGGRRTPDSEGPRTPAPLTHPRLVEATEFVKKWIYPLVKVPVEMAAGSFNLNKTDFGNEPVEEYRQEMLANAQAANWLLETASTLDDQLIVAQNLCCIDPTVCDIPSLYPRVWNRLLSLTVHAIQTCHNDRSTRNVSIAEQFGTALYHMLLCYPQSHDLWGQVASRISQEDLRPPGRPEVSYDLLVLLRGLGRVPIRKDQSYSIRKALLHRNIVDLRDQWAIEGFGAFEGTYDDAVLSLVALQISIRIGNQAASMVVRVGQSLRDLASQAYMGADLERNLGDALPAISSRICTPVATQAVHHTIQTAGIYAAFLGRIQRLAQKGTLSPPLQESLRSSLPQLFTMFRTFTRYSLEFIRLSMIAFKSLRSFWRVVYPRGFDQTTIETFLAVIQYSIIGIDRRAHADRQFALDDYLLESLEWFRTKPIPLRWVKLAQFPHIVTFLFSSLRECSEIKSSRWLAVVYTHMGDLVQRQTMNLCKDAGLAGRAAASLKRIQGPYVPAEGTSIIRHLLEISSDFHQELLDAEIVEACAEAAEARPTFAADASHNVLLDIILR
ncbi:hypothetical protein FRB90_011282, partial [Tulasnella sp. 427]